MRGASTIGVIVFAWACVRRYDVIYNSYGFNSFGYQGGCAFANATAEEAKADESARRYLCESAEFECSHDQSGSHVCVGVDGSGDEHPFEGFTFPLDATPEVW